MKLKIGGLALAAGVSPHTIRYYEKLNLLPRASRTYGGYRLYTEEDVSRLVFIKLAQKIGFSLVEIKQLLLGSDSGVEECHRISGLLSAKLAQIDNWMAEMRNFRTAIAAHLRECEENLGGKGGDCCPVLFELTQATNAMRESAITSAVNGRRSRSTKHTEIVSVDSRSSSRGAQNGSTRNYCDPLLFSNGLVR